MTAYTSRLMDLARRNQAQRTARKAAQTEAIATERLVPLEVRLKRWLATVPEANQIEGLSLEALRQQLRGRKRGGAHTGELAMALRALGFRRVRRWGANREGFAAVWRRVS
jgi:hypothetical protein